MPELEFKEDEPLKTVFVTPTMAKLAEAQGETQEPKVRFGEWIGPAEATSVGKAPIWLFVVISILVWVSIWKLFLFPNFGFHPPANPDKLDLTPGIVAELLMMGLFFLTLIPLSVMASADAARLRQRFPKQPSVSYSRVAPVHSDMRVTVLVRQNGILYGDDEGHLHFEGGSLYFEGIRTSFSISRSRLTLRPRVTGIQRFFTKAGFAANVETRLDYREDGQDFQIGLLLASGATESELVAFKSWMAKASEPGQFEVLPPRELPLSAKRDAIQALTLPLLGLQGLCYMTCFTVNLWHLIPGFGFSPTDLAPFGSVCMTILTLMFLALTLPAVVMGIVRGIRRYLFVGRTERRAT